MGTSGIGGSDGPGDYRVPFSLRETSKWNKIEHRLFSQISMNWRGRPLVSHEVIVNLIAATTTKNGIESKSGSG